MLIESIELRVVSLPLARTFVTSSSIRDRITHILVRVVGSGIVGWGECSSPIDPYYCPETTATSLSILKDFLVPAVLGRAWTEVAEVSGFYSRVKGNRFAKSGLETACWDLLAKARGLSLAELLGGTRATIESGVSLGIERDLGALFAQIDKYIDEGYRRIKLKIKPGWDIDIVRLVRNRHPGLPLQVDANSAYTLSDADRLKALDDFNLLLIEQPLGDDDIIDHARLQAMLATPICLDESIHSAEDARKALDLDACRIINIKPGRVGGFGEAKAIHDLCLARGAPVWCGGMHEFGIGRAGNIALASLPGFSLPGDISGSDKYYSEDLVAPVISARKGALDVPKGQGIGFEPVMERVERATLEKFTFIAD